MQVERRYLRENDRLFCCNKKIYLFTRLNSARKHTLLRVRVVWSWRLEDLQGIVCTRLGIQGPSSLTNDIVRSQVRWLCYADQPQQERNLRAASASLQCPRNMAVCACVRCCWVGTDVPACLIMKYYLIIYLQH